MLPVTLAVVLFSPVFMPTSSIDAICGPSGAGYPGPENFAVSFVFSRNTINTVAFAFAQGAVEGVTLQSEDGTYIFIHEKEVFAAYNAETGMGLFGKVSVKCDKIFGI